MQGLKALIRVELRAVDTAEQRLQAYAESYPELFAEVIGEFLNQDSPAAQALIQRITA